MNWRWLTRLFWNPRERWTPDILIIALATAGVALLWMEGRWLLGILVIFGASVFREVLYHIFVRARRGAHYRRNK